MATAAKNHIWIIEDQPGAQFLYREILGHDYRLELFSNLTSFSKKLISEATRPELIIADLSLDDENFLDFLQNAKSVTLLRAPFMVVSSLDDAEVLRDCFRVGAVDYLIKPFTKNELVVKVERIVERAERAAKLTDSADHDGEQMLSLDPTALTVRRGTRTALLTAKELRIFSMLYDARGKRVARKNLENEVWGDHRLASKTLDVHLFNLRKKLSRLGAEIRFVQPGGYALFDERD